MQACLQLTVYLGQPLDHLLWLSHATVAKTAAVCACTCCILCCCLATYCPSELSGEEAPRAESAPLRCWFCQQIISTSSLLFDFTATVPLFTCPSTCTAIHGRTNDMSLHPFSDSSFCLCCHACHQQNGCTETLLGGFQDWQTHSTLQTAVAKTQYHFARPRSLLES